MSFVHYQQTINLKYMPKKQDSQDNLVQKVGFFINFLRKNNIVYKVTFAGNKKIFYIVKNDDSLIEFEINYSTEIEEIKNFIRQLKDMP